MQDILAAAYDHWQLIGAVFLLMCLAWVQSGLIHVRQHIKSLNEHSAWLRSWSDDWRDIALGYAVDESDLSDDLISDLKRVSARVKAERESKGVKG